MLVSVLEQSAREATYGVSKYKLKYFRSHIIAPTLLTAKRLRK
jgi:hypothetical protein